MLFLYNEIKWVNASANNKFTDKEYDFYTTQFTHRLGLTQEQLDNIIFSMSVRAVKVTGKIGQFKHFNHITKPTITFYNEFSASTRFELDLGLVDQDKPVKLYLEYFKKDNVLIGKLNTDKDVVINNITLKAIQLTPKARYHIRNQITRNPVRI